MNNKPLSLVILVCCMLLPYVLLAQTPPVISSFSPVSGLAGSSITITGTDFNSSPSSNIVYIGGVKATVTGGSTTSLTVTVPKGAQYAPITVLNTANSLSAYSRQYFLSTQTPSKSILTKSNLTLNSPASTASGLTRLDDMVSGDLDGDGKPDLIVVSAGITGSPNNHLRIKTNTSTSSVLSFASGTDYQPGGSGYAAQGTPVIGDFDGDGSADVAAASYSRNGSNVFTSSDVFILQNNGSGTLAESGPFAVGLGVSMLTAADVDGDGKTDVISAGAQNVSILRNTTAGGTISFAASQDFAMGTSTFRVLMADIDGDNKPDMITANGASTGFRVRLNTSTPGSVSFASATTITTELNPSSITAGDIDGDGKLDLVITLARTSPTHITFASVFRNTTTGIGATPTFASSVDIEVGDTQQAATLGDINGDGKPELAIASDQNFGGSDYRFFVFNNTSTSGSISFDSSNPVTYTNHNWFASRIIIADYNDDGKQDFVYGAPTTAVIYLYRNTLQLPPVVSSFSPLTAATAATVTITGSGFNTTSNKNLVYFGATKAATVTYVNSTTITAVVPAGATLAPITVLNDDSDLSGQSLSNFLPAFSPNKAALAATDFTAQSNITATGGLNSIIAADLTRDGKPDLIQTDYSGNRLILHPNTTATPGAAITYGTATTLALTGTLNSPRYPAAADIDGDGWLDLVATSASVSNTVGVFLNPGTGALNTFALTATFGTGDLPNSAAVGDLDGDGRPDIVTANVNGSNISILRNTGTTPGSVSFAAKQDITVVALQATYYATLADIDNDGKLDIIAETDVNSNPGNIIVLRNTSTGGTISFAAGVSIPALQAPWLIVPGDIDGDGLIDLTVSYSAAAVNSVSVFRNTTSGGTISFTKTDFNVQRDQRAIALGDMNGDGKPDLVTGIQTAVSGNYFTSILPNTTTGTTISFGTRVDLAATGTPASAMVADMNADGKPDILMGNDGSPSTISVYRNTLIAPPLTQASNVVVTPTGTTANISWTSGSGDRRVIFVSAGNSGTASPVNGTDYPASSTFGAGTQIGSTGWYCIATGTGTSASVTGLTPGTTYRVMVIDYNNGGLSNTAQYQIATATNNPVNFTTNTPLTSIARAGAAAINTATADYTVTFGVPVTGLVPARFSVSASGITGASVTSVTGTGPSYTVTVNTGTGSGTLTLNMSTNTGLSPGISTTLPFAGETYTIDKTAPTLSSVGIASDNSNSSGAKTGNLVTLNFSSSETISAPTVTIATHAVTAINTGGNNWTATYTMASSDNEGTVPFSISFTDAVGNAGTSVTATTNSSIVTFDKTIPTLSSVSIASNNTIATKATTGNIITLSFTSSETISAPTVSIATHAVTATNTSGNIWTAAYTMASSDLEGAVPFNIAFSDLSANAGNNVVFTTNSSSVTFDKTALSLFSAAITSNNTFTDKAKPGNLITLNFTALEPIATPVVSIANHTVTATNTSGDNWTASYTMTTSDTEGTIPFSIVFSDQAGNAGTTVTASNNNSSILFDKTAPSLSSVTISSNNNNPSIAGAGNIISLSFTITDSGPVPVVTIGTHTVSAGHAGGTSWGASYTMTSSDSEGIIPFTIDFSDLTGNAGTTVTATTNSSSVTMDKTAPVLTAASMTSNNTGFVNVRTGNAVSVTFTANEPLSSAKVVIAGHTQNAIKISGNSWRAVYAMSAADTEGNIPFTITYIDEAGNSGTPVTATTDNTAIAYDKTPPVLNFISIKTNNIESNRAEPGNVITLSVTASEPLASLTVTIANRPATAVNTSGNNWIASLTVLDTDLNTSSVALAVFPRDFAANTISSVMNTTDASSVYIDVTFLTSLQLSSGTLSPGFSKTGVDYTASVIPAVGSINITPTAGVPSSSITINGTTVTSGSAATVPLNNGTNDLDIRVYNQSKSIFRSYRLKVIRQNPNLAPTIAAITNRILCYLPGVQTIGLSGISAGPESGQNVSLSVTSNNASLFDQLSIGAVSGGNATLSYSLKGAGTAIVTITVKDDGGTADGGTDTFVRTFTITSNTVPAAAVFSNIGTDISLGAIAELAASGGTTYSWANAAGIISGQNSAVLTVKPLVTTTYTVTVTNSSGCSITQSITVRVREDYRTINPTNILTPNGDGKNDKFVVKNLELYPNNTLKIFDRSGRIVYSKRHYTNDWEGTLNGVPLAEDAYFFVLEFGNGKGYFNGTISIVR